MTCVDDIVAIQSDCCGLQPNYYNITEGEEGSETLKSNSSLKRSEERGKRFRDSQQLLAHIGTLSKCKLVLLLIKLNLNTLHF